MNDTVRKIVQRFELIPHREGGFFREVYRSAVPVRHPGVPDAEEAGRCAGTLIYLLLADRQFSAFHRIRWTDEIWHLYAGGPLELHLIDERGGYERRVLTSDLSSGEPTAIVPAGWWQGARLGEGADWAFGGCTVAPGFEYGDFEMPPARDLIAAYPEHERLIRELTRM